MLSGIKTGKKKKRKIPESAESRHDRTSSSTKKLKSADSTSKNLSAAQQLKHQLAAGVVPTSQPKNGGLEARLSKATTVAAFTHDDHVVLTGAAAATTSDRPDYRPGV